MWFTMFTGYSQASSSFFLAKLPHADVPILIYVNIMWKFTSPKKYGKSRCRRCTYKVEYEAVNRAANVARS